MRGVAVGGTVEIESAASRARPRFNYDDIKHGVDEGGRHNTLVSYIDHLIWRGLSKDEISSLVIGWNSRNRPPLSKEELAAMVDYCYSRYAKEKTPAKKYVPTKTLNTFNSVIVGTKEFPRIDRRNHLCTPESPNPTPASDMAGSWETESNRTHTYLDCGKKRAIMRKGRAYMSFSFFCGRLGLPQVRAVLQAALDRTHARNDQKHRDLCCRDR